MKNVEENEQFLEYTSPTIIVNPSTLSYFPEDPITVYVTNGQLEVVEYIPKCTGQFLKDFMNIPCNASYYRLITIDYNINFDQCVQMLESIYRYAVTNQKGKDVPYLCRKFYSLGPCTLELEFITWNWFNQPYIAIIIHICLNIIVMWSRLFLVCILDI